METEIIETATEVVSDTDPKIVQIVLSIAAVTGAVLGANWVVRKIRNRKKTGTEVTEATDSIEPA